MGLVKSWYKRPHMAAALRRDLRCRLTMMTDRTSPLLLTCRGNCLAIFRCISDNCLYITYNYLLLISCRHILSCNADSPEALVGCAHKTLNLQSRPTKLGSLRGTKRSTCAQSQAQTAMKTCSELWCSSWGPRGKLNAYVLSRFHCWYYPHEVMMAHALQGIQKRKDVLLATWNTCHCIPLKHLQINILYL